MTEQTEREALEALFTKLHDGKSAQWLDYYGEAELSAKGRRFNALMGLNAYLDAAMMLYEEGSEFGLNWSRMSVDMGGKNWRCHVGKHRANGRTPALALCAAIRAAKDAAP